MALGTADFMLMTGDLVKVITDKYPFVPKGTIAPINCFYRNDNKYALKGFEMILIDPSELEVLSYKRGS